MIFAVVVNGAKPSLVSERMVSDTIYMALNQTLTNHLLIAMPSMKDQNFHQTVTLICQHNEDGALGIVLNRITNLTVSDILDQMKISKQGYVQNEEFVHFGGPVQTERGFILHQELGHWDSTLTVSDEMGLTTSRDILEAIAENQGPSKSLVALGYAGWGGGQLEHEIKANAWLNGPIDHDIIFSTPIDQRWSKAASLLGVDLSLISSEAGHA